MWVHTLVPYTGTEFSFTYPTELIELHHFVHLQNGFLFTIYSITNNLFIILKITYFLTLTITVAIRVI